MNNIEFDITKQLDQFNKLHSSMNYIVSKSMNDIAFEKGRKNLSNEMKDKFETRNKAFSNPRAIKINKSSKDNLEITLFHFKEQLEVQQFGGVETPKGKKLAIPVRKTFANHAGVPNNKVIPKSLKIDTILAKAPRNRGDAVYKTKGIKPFVKSKGVFIRTDEGLRLLYVFADKATHSKKLLKFQKEVERTYNVNFERFLNKNYLELLKKS